MLDGFKNVHFISSIFQAFYWVFLFLNFYSPVYADDCLELSQYQGKFSCFDEENIIQDLCLDISSINKVYVDIGAGDGVGWSNSARLALSGWSGLAVEGESIQIAKFLHMYRNIANVHVVECVATPFNVCDLLESHNIPKNFGLLSLDIDSYDYFVLESLLTKFRPTIIVAEINEKIPPPIEFTVLYEEGFCWDYSHFYGQSISQLEKLGRYHNYSIVALEYNNAILVANESYQGKILSVEEVYLQGYQLREDRKIFFPWNANMEILLSNSPKENMDFLKNYFSLYENQYYLNLPD